MPGLDRDLYPESRFEPAQLYLQLREEAERALTQKEGIGSGELLLPGIERALNFLASQCANDQERIAVMRAVAADPNSVDLSFLLGACAQVLKAEEDGRDWASRFVSKHKPSDVTPEVEASRGATSEFLADTGV